MSHIIKGFLILIGLVFLSFAINKGLVGSSTRHACINKNMTPEQCAEWYEDYDRIVNRY